MKEKERERERKKDPYGMSCHESPLKQTESLEKKRGGGGGGMEGCLCRGHKHLDRGSGAGGGGVRGRVEEGGGRTT